jgi:hypothetical protein
MSSCVRQRLVQNDPITLNEFGKHGLDTHPVQVGFIYTDHVTWPVHVGVSLDDEAHAYNSRVVGIR